MEPEFAAILCALVHGRVLEAGHCHDKLGQTHHIRVNCETDTEVIKVGLDRRNSSESLQQALFAAELTGKSRWIVVIDTDGGNDIHEYQIRVAANALGAP